MATHTIARSTLWQISSQVATLLLGVCAMKLVAVGLQKELAGAYYSAYGYLQLFGILADFGLYAVAVREVSRASDPGRTLRAFFFLRFLCIILSLSLALFFASIVPQWRGTLLPSGIFVAAFVPFFTLLSGMFRVVFQVHAAMHHVFIAEVGQRLITVLLMAMVVASVPLFSSDPHVYYIFLVIGAFGAVFLFLWSFLASYRLLPVRWSWDFSLCWHIVGIAFPYGLAYLSIALYRQLDVTLLALLRPDFAVQNAYYGFAMRIAEMAFLVPTFLLNSVLPFLHKEGGKALLCRSLTLTLILSSFMGSVAFLWARPLMALLATNHYLSDAMHPGSDTALQFLAGSMILNGVVFFSFYALLAHHRAGSLLLYTSSAAVLALLLNMFLIPRWGFMGAASTSLIVHLFLGFTLFPFTLFTLRVSFERILLRWAFFLVVFCTILSIVRPLLLSPLLTFIALCGAGFALLSFIFLSGLVQGLAVGSSVAENVG